MSFENTVNRSTWSHLTSSLVMVWCSRLIHCTKDEMTRHNLKHPTSSFRINTRRILFFVVCNISFRRCYLGNLHPNIRHFNASVLQSTRIVLVCHAFTWQVIIRAVTVRFIRSICNPITFICKEIEPPLYSRYYTETCNEMRDPSTRFAPRQHSSEEKLRGWRQSPIWPARYSNPRPLVPTADHLADVLVTNSRSKMEVPLTQVHGTNQSSISSCWSISFMASAGNCPVVGATTELSSWKVNLESEFTGQSKFHCTILDTFITCTLWIDDLAVSSANTWREIVSDRVQFSSRNFCQVQNSISIVWLIFSFLFSCHEKATEALCKGRIQTCLGVALVSEFSAWILLLTSSICCSLDSTKQR